MSNPSIANKTNKTNKASIIITAETVCDLPKKLREQFQIELIPFVIDTDGGRFHDTIEVGSDNLAEYMYQGKVAKSYSQQMEDYVAFFKEQLKKADHVIHISVSSAISRAYVRACEAAQLTGNVTVVNSMNLSSAMGLLVLYAAELAQSGCALEEIIPLLEEYRSHVHSEFLVRELDCLARSKKISPLASDLAYRFMLRPVFRLKKGKIRFQKLMHGAWKSTMRRYIKHTLKSVKAIDKKRVFITHVGLNEETIDYIKGEVAQRVNFEEIIVVKASAAVACNCGPGSFGILFAKGNVDHIPEKLSSEEMLDQLTFMDWKTGLMYSADNMELYLEILREYIGDNKEPQMTQLLKEEKWEEYRVLAHALKGTSKTIGIMDLSEAAKGLEFACKELDYDYVRENHESVMEHYKTVRERIGKVIG